jgi:O-antigen biosynthesis protein
MHRSGTSALARALPVLGVELGDRLMPAVAGDNDKGFWEDLDVNALNIEVLNTLGTEWYAVGPLSELAFERTDIQRLRARAVGVLEDKLASCIAFGVKDPRIARLLPFWRSVFRELGLKVAYLLAVRNPLSVARSLAARHGFAEEQSYALWMEYTMQSFVGTRGGARLCVDFDELMLDPARQLRRIGRLLGREVDEPAAREYAALFLDPNLRHTRFFIGDLEGQPCVPAELRKLYSLVRRVAIDDRPDAWSAIDRYLGRHTEL